MGEKLSAGSQNLGPSRLGKSREVRVYVYRCSYMTLWQKWDMGDNGTEQRTEREARTEGEVNRGI